MKNTENELLRCSEDNELYCTVGPCMPTVAIVKKMNYFTAMLPCVVKIMNYFTAVLP